MSILIKGMEMPRSCAECYVAWEKCHRTVEWYKNNPQYYDIRHEDCPLVPVPPHGRLIDADAMAKLDRMVGKLMMYGGEYVYTQAEIDRAPTIIEAEAKET